MPVVRFVQTPSLTQKLPLSILNVLRDSDGLEQSEIEDVKTRE